MPDGNPPLRIELNPFLDGDAPTFADVMVELGTDRTLTVSKRRNVLSSIRCLLRFLGKDSQSTPANLGALREPLKTFHPRQAGITEKRWANIKCDVTFALKHLGLTASRSTKNIPLAPVWRSSWDGIEDDQIRWKLSRLFHFCSALEIEPQDVDDNTIAHFHNALIEESFVKNPRQTVTTTINSWNRAKEMIECWPARNLSRLPTQKTGWTFPLEEFPASFNQDIERWVSRLRRDDPFAEDGPAKPLRQITIEHRIFQIRMFAAALVRRNVPKNCVTSLTVLVKIENFKESILFMIDGNADKKSTEGIYNCAMAIKAIATHHVKVPDEHLRQLKNICARIKTNNFGLSPKNQRRLEQFNDPFNVSEFLLLPERLEKLAKRSAGRKSAVMMQMAVAVEILTVLPLRIKNLASLKLGETIYWTRPGRKGRLMVSIPPDQVKSGRAIEAEIPGESVRLILNYLENYRSHLFDNPGDWLFPGLNGKAKKPNTLGRQIKDTVFKHSGLEINAHLFRHIDAKLYLSKNPGSYEVVRRSLGHASAETTAKFYVGFDNTDALRHFDETILEMRSAAVPRIGRRRKKSS